MKFVGPKEQEINQAVKAFDDAVTIQKTYDQQDSRFVYGPMVLFYRLRKKDRA